MCHFFGCDRNLWQSRQVAWQTSQVARTYQIISPFDLGQILVELLNVPSGITDRYADSTTGSHIKTFCNRSKIAWKQLFRRKPRWLTALPRNMQFGCDRASMLLLSFPPHRARYAAESCNFPFRALFCFAEFGHCLMHSAFSN